MKIQESIHNFLSQNARLFGRKPKFLVGCSGGPDSTALLHALSKAALSGRFSIEAVHVNHQLRGRESEADSRFVKKTASSLGIKCRVQLASMKYHWRGNLEEGARVKRYTAFKKIAIQNKCKAVLTGHTLDDQVETVFMNMIRGVGPEGLGGIHSIRRLLGSRSIFLGRPMLESSKNEVLDYLRANRLKYRTDSSNNNIRFQRNWLRGKLMPLIESRSPGFKARMVNLSQMLREEVDYWEAVLTEAEDDVFRESREGRLLDFKRLLRYPAAVQRRLLRRVTGGNLLTFNGVEGLRRWLNSPPTNGRVWQLRKGWIVERLSKSKGSPSAKLFRLDHIPNEK